MSKLSFRARALDASKPMFIYKADEIPDLPDFAAINRAVPQMPTGMEKEEETEHHLQRALSAQQVYGTSEAREIPVPDVSYIGSRYCDLYQPVTDYKPPRQYIHVQPWGMDQEIPDYDMDSEDEQWLMKQAKNLKMEVTPIKFENMMDRLEKGSGQTVVTLQEAKALLKEDDDLTIAVYDYWLNKRLRLQHPLIPAVKTEKRDGSTTNNPYVAFRRRTEKMQTRKNRKNDEASYEKMLKLRRDLNKALTILEMMKRREKSKKELLQLTIEVMEKRYQMEDWEGKSLQEAMAQRHKLPAFVPLHNFGRGWEATADGSYVKKKREYKKRKHKQQASSVAGQQAAVQLPQYNEVDVLHHEFTSDEEAVSPQMSPSDQEIEDDPDGVYAFRRKAGCSYHAPISDTLGNWPWCGPEEGGFGEKRYRYSLASINQPRRCLGLVRRRIGRGGRIILDKALTPWDDYLSELDVSSPISSTGWVAEYTNYIRDTKISHFRPRTPTDDLRVGGSGLQDTLSPLIATEFNVESFQNHQEQLLQMQQQQQEQLLKQETDLALNSSFDIENSFSSQPTSRFTLDSASAQFAASALCNSAQELVQQEGSCNPSGANTNAVSLSESTIPVTTVTNGPIMDAKASGLSTSPAANVLQLNFPLTNNSTESTVSQRKTNLSSPLSSNKAPWLSTCVTCSQENTTSAGYQVTPAIATKAVPVATKSLPSAAPSTHLRQNNSSVKTQTRTPKENHENANSIVKNEVVAMEVT